MEGPIPKPYAMETCKLGQMAECCRYLACDKNGFCCLKGTKLQKTVDERAEAKTMNAQADNCVGWEKLRPAIAPEARP